MHYSDLVSKLSEEVRERLLLPFLRSIAIDDSKHIDLITHFLYHWLRQVLLSSRVIRVEKYKSNMLKDGKKDTQALD